MSRFPLLAALFVTLLPAAGLGWQADQPQPASAPAAQKPPAKPVREFNDESSTPAPTPTPAPPQAPATVPAAQTPAPNLPQRDQQMRDIAERFAPVLYQRMAGTAAEHRFDYPTNFDFDGDWKGNNNWANAADSKFKLWSYVYYSVIESEDHYFIHYAVYHPRDWSVVQASFDSILDKLQDKYKEIMGGGARQEVEFNHENDLEGALVIVDKWAPGGPQPVAMETVAHNHLLRSLSAAAVGLGITSGERGQRLRLEDGHPILYIESQKHGIHAWRDEESSAEEPILVLRYSKPVEFSRVSGLTATYELVPIAKTWWKHARETHKPNLTFGTVASFGDRFCQVPGAQRPTCVLGTVGAAIRGDYLRPNAASAPWNWIDLDDKTLPLGAWFFDPIVILKRHFGLFDTKEKYLYNPYLGIGDADSGPRKATTP